MATQTITTSGDIPKALESFYTGQPGQPGLIERGIGAIFPGGLTGEQAFAARYAPLYQAGLMGRGEIAGLSPMQQQVQRGLTGMTTPGEFTAAGTAGTMASQAFQRLTGQQALGVAAPELTRFQMGAAPQVSNIPQATTSGISGATTKFAPNLQQYLMGPAQSVGAQQIGMGSLQAAQTRFDPNLQRFQMGAVQDISGTPQISTRDIQSAQTAFDPNLQRFQMGPAGVFDAGQAQAYMSPYMQQVVDAQQRQAIEAAQKAQLGQNLAAARQGTYGGARQALLQGERESGLRQQLGDIQARGLQDAYSQAQQQFERDRAAQMNVGAQNLAAALGVQQLGTQTGLQTALANLSNEQQARVQSEANRLQAQGMNQEQAMRAALANQQTQLTGAQQNLQAALGVQQLGAQTGLQTALANLSNEQQARVQQEANRLQAQGMNQQAALQAALANQQAGLTTGQQNLASLLQTQQLGTQTGLQTALANLSNEQQARVQSEANRLQASGMNQQAALQAALANQQAQLGVGQQNLAAALGVQQLGAGQSLEAQRANQAAALQAQQQQLGAAQGLGGLAQTLGGLGTQRLAGELDILKTQGAFGDLQRNLAQQQLDAQRSALMQQAEYGQTQVGQLSNLLRGIPMTDTTQRTTTPPPSFASQLTGMGLTGIGLYNLMQGGK